MLAWQPALPVYIIIIIITIIIIIIIIIRISRGFEIDKEPARF